MRLSNPNLTDEVLVNYVYPPVSLHNNVTGDFFNKRAIHSRHDEPRCGRYQEYIVRDRQQEMRAIHHDNLYSSTSATAATNVTTDVSPEPVILQIQDNGNDLEEEGGDDFVDIDDMLLDLEELGLSRLLQRPLQRTR
ncbi:hypothetical protein V8E54_006443 [Elaphomyces granulatus]